VTDDVRNGNSHFCDVVLTLLYVNQRKCHISTDCGTN